MSAIMRVGAVLALMLAVAAALESVPVADNTASIPRVRAIPIDDRVAAMRSEMASDVDRVARLDKGQTRETRAGRRRSSDVSDDDSDDRQRRGAGIRKFNAKTDKITMFDGEGVWYQIAVNRDFYNRYQKGCSCPIEVAQARNATFANIAYACANTTGESKGLTIVRGTKLQLPNGEFVMTMKGKQIGGKSKGASSHSQNVLAIDENRKWVLLRAKKLGGVFLYSRSSKMDEDLLNKLFAFIEKHSNGKLSAKDMKVNKHTEQCSRLMRPLLRKFKARSRSSSRSRSRSHSRERDAVPSGFRDSFINREMSSGAEPPIRTAKDEKPEARAKQTLDLNLLKGQWFEVARSRKAKGGLGSGCACSIGFIDVSGNTLNQQCTCLNTTATGDDKVASKTFRLVMDDKQQGVFKAKAMSASPGKLSEDDQKEFKVVLLALGDDFAVCLNADQKYIHILSRKPTMEAELKTALGQMVQSVGINPKDLEDVKQDDATCKEFHTKAKTRFGAAASPSVAGLDKPKPTPTAKLEDSDDSSRKPLKESDSSFVGDSEGTQYMVRYLPVVSEVAPLEAQPEPLPQQVKAEEQPADAPAPAFDTNVMAGNWFVEALSQSAYDKYTRGCECLQGFATAIDPSRIHLITACHNTTDNQMTMCVKEGVQDAASPGLFRFELLEKQPYGLSAAEKAERIERVVLASGKDFAVIGEPALNAAIILSRAPSMNAELYSRLTSLVAAIGFDKATLRKVKHDLPQCQAVTTQMQNLGKGAAQPAPAPAAPAPAAAPAAPAALPAAPAPAAPAAPAPAAPAAPAPAAPAAPAPAAPAAPAPLPPAPAGRLIGEQQQFAAEPSSFYGQDQYYADEQ